MTHTAVCLLPLIYSNTLLAAGQGDKITVISVGRTEQNLSESQVSMQVIDSEKMNRFTEDQMTEALRDIPEVDIVDSSLAGREQIRIRGEKASRVLVLIDSQEVTYQCAEPNYSLSLLIDPSYVEHVKVVK
ncbi:MAG: TonB-dependent receptor plug domain-containing protein [Candidatus Malihini olakiniferum]